MRCLEDFIGAVAIVLFGVLGLWLAWVLEPLERHLRGQDVQPEQVIVPAAPPAHQPAELPLDAGQRLGAIPSSDLTRRPPPPATLHPGGE